MDGPQYRLLVVEDDVSTNPEIVEVFELTGFAVETAVTGPQAAELLKENTYDAVVLDNMMPPGENDDSEWSMEKTQGGLRTGLEVLRRIAELPEPPPVWVVTALPDDYVESEELKFEFVQGYLKKPISLAELSGQIRRHLERYGEESAA